jgi:zinc transporter
MAASTGESPSSATPPLRFVLLLDGKGGARQVGLEALRDWKPEQGPVWVHLDSRSSEDMAWLQEASGLPRIDHEVLLARKGRARLEVTGPESVLAVLDNSVAPEGHIRAREPEPLRLWGEPMRLITCGSPPLPAIQDCCAAITTGGGARSIPELLVLLTSRRLAYHEAQGAELDDILTDFEEALEEDKPVSATELRHIRQRALQLRCRLAPLRELLVQLRATAPPWLREDAALWRELVNTSLHQLEQLDALLQRAALVQEQLEQRTRARTERAIYIITLLSGIFLPLSLVASLLGMNVGGLPWAESPWGFLFICILMVLMALGAYLLLRRRHLV